MYTVGTSASPATGCRILVVRLGAMGDIIHTLPAVAGLKQAHPGSQLIWVVEPRWAPLLAENPFVDRVVFLRRGSAAPLLESWRELRTERYDFAVDFQGLLKSALVAAAARPGRIFGFQQTRESAATLFYSHKTVTRSAHVVDRNLDLAAAAGDALPPGPPAISPRVFPLPAGTPEGDLPKKDFVLVSPLAGWRSKQWPPEHYAALAARMERDLGIPLVFNLPPGAEFPEIQGACRHYSGLPGLIDATRRAAAVLGIDSGPMHLAAALGKPGVAIFGPTDPARNGPYGGGLKVMRSPGAETTYKRGSTIPESMRRITPDRVFEALKTVLGGCLV